MAKWTEQMCRVVARVIGEHDRVIDAADDLAELGVTIDAAKYQFREFNMGKLSEYTRKARSTAAAFDAFGCDGVTLPCPPNVPSVEVCDETRKIAFIPDTHIPFHHARAWMLTLEILNWWRPDTIVILGDFFDFYAPSRFDKSPKRQQRLVDELAFSRGFLDQLESMGASRLVYLEGNHENRLARYVTSNAPALDGLPGLSVPEVLKLDAWEYLPYRKRLKIGDAHVSHDVDNKCGVTAIRRSLVSEMRSTIIGHIHRAGTEVMMNADGDRLIGQSFGWLGDAEQIDYRDKATAAREWPLGIGVGYYDDKHLDAHPVVYANNGSRACLEGKVFRS